MVIHGHVENGIIIPHGNILAPAGTEVTITVRDHSELIADAMSDDQKRQYLAALSRIDSVANENAGDSFSGADHDRELYGGRK